MDPGKGRIKGNGTSQSCTAIHGLLRMFCGSSSRAGIVTSHASPSYRLGTMTRYGAFPPAQETPLFSNCGHMMNLRFRRVPHSRCEYRNQSGDLHQYLVWLD
jgi:hypothetical protein